MSENTRGYLEVRSAYTTLSKEVEFAIERENFDLRCKLILLIDKPTGFALKTMLDNKLENVVIITDNPCPEYWADLWEFDPQMLLAGGHSVEELIAALKRAVGGERCCKTPYRGSVLTDREREVLRLCAMNLSNKQIAQHIMVKQRTIKSHLNSVYSKLSLEGRGEAILYYWGLWQWLQRDDSLQ